MIISSSIAVSNRTWYFDFLVAFPVYTARSSSTIVATSIPLFLAAKVYIPLSRVFFGGVLGLIGVTVPGVMILLGPVNRL